ncbi:Subtilisin-like protease SBT1.9 [Zea mays]|uniref:Subtilisin-like protease SBT1.9 n=1 Tax=Zea mays TaxID=4577 RepID=A0A1D6HFJ2_MAIZE|nr:Subtilisin-like protease SBT1.9 [Zea mays]
MGEVMIIGILDAGITTIGQINANSKAKGMPPPPVKWKDRCDNNQACNNKLIGFKTFVDTSDTCGNSLLQRASVLGIEYDKAFAVAPKAHLVMYHVCDEECHPKEVRAGMDSAVDDDVDVISMSFNGTEDNMVFHDDVVTAPWYNVVAQCLLYDLTVGEFIPYLCVMSLDADRKCKIVEPTHASCAEIGEIATKDLNYPSIMIFTGNDVWQVEAKQSVTKPYMAQCKWPGPLKI